MKVSSSLKAGDFKVDGWVGCKIHTRPGSGIGPETPPPIITMILQTNPRAGAPPNVCLLLTKEECIDLAAELMNAASYKEE